MEQKSLKSLYHCVYALQYHLVMVTKFRKPCLTRAMLKSFEVQAAERCEAWGGSLIEVNGEADHVHLLIELPPTIVLAEFVNALKTGTSRRLRNDFRAELHGVYTKPVLWSRSYCIVSCGGAPLETIKTYIQRQKRPEV
jgi:putative transposase